MKHSITLNTDNRERTEKYLERFSEKLDGIPADIFLGNTDDAISAAASVLLDKALSTEDGKVGYAIYAEGGKIAAVWSDFRLEEAAISHLAENMGDISDGYLALKAFDLMEYLTERAERVKGERWAALEAAIGPKYGPGIVKELKALYELFPDSLVTWLANLYEPNKGGWYWSNSARDYMRYLPSLEETYEAMGFIESSGMCEMFDNDWTKAMPDFVKDKIADFFLGMQDEDTFFYNVQWPKEYIFENGCQPRITRDIGTAERVLRRLGVEPKYKKTAPPQPKIEKKAEEEKKKEKPRMLAQYESAENFKEYLEGLEANIMSQPTPERRAYQFYYYGNLFQSTTRYVNANPELRQLLIDFLEKHQNPETGMWSEVVCFNATNGLHKIASVANAIGYPMKYIDKMVDTTMKIIASSPEDNPANGGVDIYNAWSCFPYIYYNILHFGSGTEEERRKRKEEIKTRVLASAAETIRIGCRQMYAFRREDGAYSYGRFGCVAKAQGCPIAVFGIGPESDINGNGIAALALKQHIFMALELQEYEVPLYTERERAIFMNEIERIRRDGQVEKKKLPFTVAAKNPDSKYLREVMSSLDDFVEIDRYIDYSPVEIERQIIIGDFDRGVVNESKRKLAAALEGADEDTVGFAISSGEGRYSIYLSDDRILEAAIEHFKRTFPACDCTRTFSLTEYLKERGEKIKEGKWQALKNALLKECSEELAEPIVRELKAMQSMFTTENATWMANLYDPKIGGFYCSNSARDNEGFLPDIETTYLVSCFMESSGMSEMYGNNWVKALPDWLKEKIGNYIYNCQNEDGFFYNIQWPRDFILAEAALRQPRVTRDAGAAMYVLKRLGITPKYETEQKVEKKDKDNEPRLLSQFDSPEAFREYMKGIEDVISPLDAEGRAERFYYYGNMFQSLTVYLNRDEEIKKIFIDFLEKYQSKKTGVWSEVMCYHATNGLLKIASIANKIGYRLRYVDEMLTTVMALISKTVEEYPVAGGVYIVNAWTCLRLIYENILTYGDGSEQERRAKKAAIKARVLENAPELIKIASGQLKMFRRADGSFSYGHKSYATALSCPLRIGGLEEGDIGGNVLAVNGVRRSILAALDLSDYMVPIFSEYERHLFVSIIENLNENYENER